MAADFNAGSIEGTLDLDSTPFRAGLNKAKTDAKAFEDAKIEPTLGLDSAAFDAERIKAAEEMRELGAKKARPEVDPKGILGALAQIELVKRAMNGLGKSKVGNFGAGALAPAEGLAGSLAKMTLMPAAILSIIAALGPATAAVVAFGGAAVVAFGGAGIALGLFAKLVASDMKTIQDATKAGITLEGPAGKAQKALKSLGKAWADFKKQTSGPVFGFLADAFDLAAKVLPKFEPLMKSVARGMDGVLKVLGKFTQGPLFERFLKSLQGFMQGFLQGLGPALVSLLSAFMNLFIGLQPLISMLGHGLMMGLDAANKFGKSLQHGGISDFVLMMKANLPLLGHLVSALFTAFNGLTKSLAPLAGPALQFLTDMLLAIGHLNLTPLAAGLGAVLTAVGPLLGPLSDLINTMLVPLGELLKDIADSAITPFATSLQSALAPALASISSILDALEPPLAAFVASIANLANPTGVAFITTLLDDMKAVIEPLAGPVGELAVALEGLVDNALSILTPGLKDANGPLGVFATGLGKVASGMAAVLKQKAAAGVLLSILGIIAATKAYTVTVAGIAVVTGVLEAMALGWAGVAVATDASTAALFANKAAMIAWRVYALAAATVTGIWSAAQWALNAALTANPIGLIVVGVVALAAALVLAYKKVGWFHKAVDALFGFIKKYWPLLVGILTGPFGVAVIMIVKHWSTIKKGATTTVNWIKDKFGKLVDFFRGLPGKIGNAVSGMWDGIKDGFKAALNAVIDLWNNFPHLHIPGFDALGKHIGGVDIGLPHLGHLAKGGVTNGPGSAVLGDNLGGHEAVIPLDKYDLPKKGENASMARMAAEANSRMIDLLAALVHATTQNSPEALAEALADILKTHTGTQTRALIQATRAA
jgi:phage-related protein